MKLGMRRANLVAFAFFLAWPMILGTAIVATMFAAPGASAQEKMASTAESTAITQAIANFADNFNRHDANAASMAFADDADLTNIRGGVTHGQPAIKAAYEGLFKGRLKNAHRTVAVTNIRMLSSTVAAVDCKWETSGTTADDGSTMPVRHGLLVLSMTKTKGQWIIATYHEPETAPEK